MALDRCCNGYVMSSSPNSPGTTGIFTEIHACPTCKKKIIIRFQVEAVLGGEVVASAVAAGYATSR